MKKAIQDPIEVSLEKFKELVESEGDRIMYLTLKFDSNPELIDAIQIEDKIYYPKTDESKT